jgi:hypothetical protein
VKRPWLLTLDFYFIDNWVQIKNIYNDLCVVSLGHGIELKQAVCRGTDEFAWFIEYHYDGTVSFINKAHFTAIDNTRGLNGTDYNLLSIRRNGNKGQRWKILESDIFNYFLFMSGETNLCMYNSDFAMANYGYKLKKCAEKFMTEQFTFEKIKFEKFESHELFINALTRYRKVLKKCKDKKDKNKNDKETIDKSNIANEKIDKEKIEGY